MESGETVTFLRAAAAALDTYRTAHQHRRHGIVDLMLYEHLVGLALDDGLTVSPDQAMAAVLDAGEEVPSILLDENTGQVEADDFNDLLEHLNVLRVERWVD